MKVAILGGRGIPACYGGFDTLIDELAVGLAEANSLNKVLVYCRSNYYKERPKTYRGVELVYLPAPRLKAVESLLHSFLSALHVLLKSPDVIFFVDPANAPFCVLLRMFGRKVIIHTDGLGWKRIKWGPCARRYYKFVEWLSAKTANTLVTDNTGMQSYYRKEYGADSVYIPYGASNREGLDESVFKSMGVTPRQYFLVVARLDPENNTDLIIKEYSKTTVKMPLIVVGDAPYDSEYLKRLHELSDDRTHLVGRINDQAKLNALYSQAYCYIHGHEVGGTNPSLLRAMHYGTASVVIDSPFNMEVIADCGYVFSKEEGALARLLDKIEMLGMEISRKGDMTRQRADTYFRWDAVIRDYDRLFRTFLKKQDNPDQK